MTDLYRRYGKRLFDVMVTLALMPLLAPLLIGVGIFVRFKLGSPVLFRQLRPGLRGKKFLLYKFRTMTSQRDHSGKLLPDSERLGAFGSFLRSTSLDELPEFWNILLGQMSLVGPRPLLTEYLDRFTPEQARRHQVRPGLTGWAQVNGRNAIEWEKKFMLDVWYVDHLNLGFDLRILLATFLQSFSSKGVNADGHVSMPKFTGSSRNAADATAISRAHESPTLASQPVAIIGAGGHAKVVAATLLASGNSIEAFYDDDRSLWQSSNFAGEIRGPLETLKDCCPGRAILAIGDNAVRCQLVERLRLNWTSAIHPNAYVHPTVNLGEGVLVCVGALVQPDVRVGAHSIINTGATVDHDTVLGKFVHVAPGVHLAGGVVVGDGVLMGIGSSAIPGVAIGKNTIVGAGAIVTNDLPANSIAVGIPAKVVKSLHLRENAGRAA